jgi:hypothetical protein
VDISGDASIRTVLERSNIETADRDVQQRVLEEVLAKANLTPSDVLAVSQAEVSLKPDGSSMGTRPMLVVVVKSGIAMAEQKGLRAKRVDMQTVSYKTISAALPDEKLYDPRRGEMAIQAMVGGSVPLFRLGWHWSQRGPVTAGQAAAERDRILNTIHRAIRGEWDTPIPSPVTGADSSPAMLSYGGASSPALAIRSQKAHLIDWAAGLFREAGLAPAREQVEDVARTAAIGLFVSRVVAFADSRPLPSLQQYCRSLPGELPARFDQFDDIYAMWIRLATEEDAQTQDRSSPEYLRIQRRHQELADQVIDQCLADSRDSFLQGVHDDYGQPDGPAASEAGPDGPVADAAEPPSGSAWEAVKGRARRAQQHINPLAVQHGIESLQGALTESGVAKIDKNTGQMKFKKTGIARAAIQPARALRRAAEGAAVSEHLKAYNESRAARYQAGSAPGPGQPTAASSAEEFASYASKRDYLRDWARRLVIAASLPPTEQLVLEHANTAATAITQTVLARLAPGLGQRSRDHTVPQGTPLDAVDTLYAKTVELARGQRAVDEAIVAFLDSCHDDWVQGIRQHYR